MQSIGELLPKPQVNPLVRSLKYYRTFIRFTAHKLYSHRKIKIFNQRRISVNASSQKVRELCSEGPDKLGNRSG